MAEQTGNLTFGIIKPDAVRAGKTGAILQRVLDAGFRLRAMKLIHMTRPEAEGFYAVHRERPFFPELTSFMSSAPCVVMALEKENVQYPDEPVTLQPRFRGQHLLHVDELGREKCVACYLCAAACPSDCIYIVAADDPRPPKERTGVDERYASVYNIDYGRCILCGFCVEACPKDAITHGFNFELSVYSRADLLKTKDDLLITKQKQSSNYRVAFADEDVDSEYKVV